jgi:hypothetical protein
MSGVRAVTYGVGGIAAVAGLTDAGILYARGGRFSRLFQQELAFPSDLLRSGNLASDGAEAPYMSMQFSAYRRRSITEQPFYEGQMKIRLPIPEGLVEQTSVSYNKAELGSAAGSVVDAASLRPSGSLTEIAGQVGTGIATAASGVGTAALRNVIAGVAGEGNAQVGLNALSAISGITANPFQTVLFKSPEFRAHTFRWKFAPETAAETNMLRDIINTFKYHSLPGISAAGGVFFSYPEILEINFRPSDEFLYKFKPCVVESITVNFAPGNGPSFYRSTNAPTALQLELRVQEIEIWTKADYLNRDASGRFNNPVSIFR